MPTLAEILPGKMSLEIECVDRVYLNGYVPDLQMGVGAVNFIREQFKWSIPSPKAMYEMTERFKRAVELYAESLGRAIYAFGKAQEKSNAFHSQHKDQGKKVWFEYERRTVQVTHNYFYLMNKEFGLSFIKVCTYLLFEVKVCLNGHEWAKRQLQHNQIGFGPWTTALPVARMQSCYKAFVTS